MKKIKKAFIVFLCVTLALTVSPLSAYAAAKPAAPKVTAASTVNSVTLKWKKVADAKCYYVYSYNTKTKKYKKIGKTAKVKYKVKKLKDATAYYYAVRTFNKRKKLSAYSKKVTVSTLPKAPASLKAAASGDNAIKVTWTKSSRVTKYKVVYSTSSSMANAKTVYTKKNSIILSSLASNNTYYIRVYAIKTLNKKNYVSKYSYASCKLTSIRSQVDTTVKYQTIDGFGASAAWWAHKIGNWEGAEKIIKYLYDRDEGIGLNIYRYNVGAGSRADETITNYWARTDSFATYYNSDYDRIFFDVNNDSNAQKAMSIAKRLYGDDLRVVLFANSPPTAITRNGKAYCNPDPTHQELENIYTNILPDKYPVYAQYFTEIADYFVDEGYRVVDISPVNEPQYRWCCSDDFTSMSQEGCHYGPIKLSQMMEQFVKKCEGKPYKVSMFEAGGAEGGSEFRTYLDSIMDNATNSKYFTSVSVHSYWHDKVNKKQCYDYIQKTYPGMTVACTEYCQMTNDMNTGIWEKSAPIEWWDPARNGLTIDYGVQMARVINEDLTVLNATEWNWWTGVSNGYYPDGLVYIDHEDNDHNFVETSKRLWCLGNYSKFIDEGAKRVKITEAQGNIISSAFLNPDGKLVVVYVNTTESAQKVQLSAGNYSNCRIYETSETRDLELTEDSQFTNGRQITLPSTSVISVILS